VGFCGRGKLSSKFPQQLQKTAAAEPFLDQRNIPLKDATVIPNFNFRFQLGSKKIEFFFPFPVIPLHSQSSQTETAALWTRGFEAEGRTSYNNKDLPSKQRRIKCLSLRLVGICGHEMDLRKHGRILLLPEWESDLP